MSALNPVRVCAATAILWTFAILPASSQGRVESNVASGSGTLAACEKELGRVFFKFLFGSGVLKGGSVAALNYKGFKLSNSLEQKDVTRFLKEHGLSNPKTIRNVSRPVTSFVRGKTFRRGSLAGVVVGGVMVAAEFLPPEYLPGFRAPNGPAKESSNIIITPPLDPTDSVGSDSVGKESVGGDLVGSETPDEEMIRVAQRKFGDKYEVALLLVSHSMTITEVDDGRRAIFSDMRKCAKEIGYDAPPSVRQRLTNRIAADPRLPKLNADQESLRSVLGSDADLNLARCVDKRPRIVCELEDPRVVKITKRILSHVVYENGELSLEMSDFE